MAAHADTVISVRMAGRRKVFTSRLTTEGEISRAWWGHLLWGFSAGVLGFACAFGSFATALELPRPLFVLCYLVAASQFLYGYVMWSRSHPVRLLRQHWVWGVVGAVAIGAFVVFRNRGQGPGHRERRHDPADTSSPLTR